MYKIISSPFTLFFPPPFGCFKQAILEGNAKKTERTESFQRRSYNMAMYSTCEVALVSDFLFYSATGQSSVTVTTNTMVSWLSQVTIIYKSTDFTGVGLGIQLALKQLTIYTDTNNIYASTTTDSSVFLNLVSQGDPQTGNWNNVCAAHVLTHRTFSGGILGLAWVGSQTAGICSTASGGQSLNTGISTSQSFGTDLPVIVSIITMAHEFGHNFGSLVRRGKGLILCIGLQAR